MKKYISGLISFVLSLSLCPNTFIVFADEEDENKSIETTLKFIDEETQAPIPFAEFVVKDTDGYPISFEWNDEGYYEVTDEGEYSSMYATENGIIKIGNLTEGVEYRIEAFSRNSFNSINEAYIFVPSSNSDSVIEISYEKSCGMVTIKATTDKNEPAENAMFEIHKGDQTIHFNYSSEGAFVAEDFGDLGQLLTNNNGEIIIEDIALGTYTIVQKFDNDFYSSEDIEIEVEVIENETTEVEFKNKVNKGNLTILSNDDRGDHVKTGYVINDLNGNPLTFTLRDSKYVFDANSSQTILTVNNGKVDVTGIRTGTYTVAPVETLDTCDPLAACNILIKNNATSEVNFNYTRIYGNLDITKNNSEGTPFEGVGYKITDSNGHIVKFELKDKTSNSYVAGDAGSDIVYTDSKGEIHIENIPAGNIKIEEFIKDESSTQNIVKILKGQKNIYSSDGYIHNIIPIVNENDELLKITAIEFIQGTDGQLIMPDDFGYIDISTLEDGEYIVNTRGVPSGYSNIKHAKVVVKNGEIGGNKIEIERAVIKVKYDGHEKNVVFSLISTDGYNKELTIDANGECLFDNIEYGEYTLTKLGEDEMTSIHQTVIVNELYSNSDGFFSISIDDISAMDGFNEFSKETRTKVAIIAFLIGFSVSFAIFIFLDKKANNKVKGDT